MRVHEGDQTPRPPFSADLLSDLHAGVLPDDVSARLWPLVRQDPAALEVLAALDAVSARLRETGSDHNLGTPAPPEVVTRIEAALRDQAGRPLADPVLTDGPAWPQNPARSRRRRIRTRITVAVAAAAAAGAAVFALSGVDFGDSDGPAVVASPVTASPSTAPARQVVDLGADIDDNQILALMNHTSAALPSGRLADPALRSACLQGIGIDASAPVLATRQVRFRDQDAVLVLVAGPRPPTLTAVIVGPTCDGTGADLLARDEIG